MNGQQDKRPLSRGIMIAMNSKTIKAVMSELGRRGGASTSNAKKEAVRKSLAKARKARWAHLDAVAPPAGSQTGKATVETWRSGRKPLLKPSQRGK